MKVHKDEIKVKMISPLGISYGEMIMPKSMEKGLIKTYLKSGAVKSIYLYINNQEITNGLNHNPCSEI